jgi:hypothetical protein
MAKASKAVKEVKLVKKAKPPVVKKQEYKTIFTGAFPIKVKV